MTFSMAPSSNTFALLLSLIDIESLLKIGIATGRFIGFALVFPLLTWIQINGILRFALAMALAIGAASLPETGASLASMSPFFLPLLMAKEIFVGSVLGIMLGLPIWAAYAAGDILDSFRGANASNLFDPLNSDEVTVSGQVIALIAMITIIAADAFPIIIELIYSSFLIIPISSFGSAFEVERLAYIKSFLDRLLAYAMIIAFPMLIVFVLIEIAVAIQARVARVFNIENIAPAFKSLAYITIVPIYVSFLYYYFEAGFRQSLRELFGLFGAP